MSPGELQLNLLAVLHADNKGFACKRREETAVDIIYGSIPEDLPGTGLYLLISGTIEYADS